jgi:hypothetical protein
MLSLPNPMTIGHMRVRLLVPVPTLRTMALNWNFVDLYWYASGALRDPTPTLIGRNRRRVSAAGEATL